MYCVRQFDSMRIPASAEVRRSRRIRLGVRSGWICGILSMCLHRRDDCFSVREDNLSVVTFRRTANKCIVILAPMWEGLLALRISM